MKVFIVVCLSVFLFSTGFVAGDFHEQYKNGATFSTGIVFDNNPAISGIQGGAIGPLVRDTVIIHDTVRLEDNPTNHYWYWYKSVTLRGHGGTFEGHGLLHKGDTVSDPQGEIIVVASEGHLLKN